MTHSDDPHPTDPHPPHSREQIRQADRRAANDAWSAFSLITAGVLVWGGLGWAAAHWLDQQWALPVGIILGAGVALYAIWMRYGKLPPSDHTEDL